MATLKAIRRRVSSVRNIQQITKAMKMISAARLRRAQEAAFAARPYAGKLEEVLQNLAQSQTLAHPLLTAREEHNIDLVFITSDRGLCGGFNANLIRTAETFIREHRAQKVTLSLVGRRGFDYFKRRPVTIVEQHINLFGRLTAALAHEIGTRMSQRFLNGETDAVYILYARFRSALVQVPTIDRILPVIAKERSVTDVPLEYVYEPEPQTLLASLLARYIDMLIYRAMLESVASEHGARMTAMDNATNNAVDMIERLTLDMNRARQAGITRELLEIVSTGEALK
ncbi:MAG: ATP synthase F1 subunit gamma [Deltaproteobacteria bacterium]|nr:ATP synthase F1 subunit gamma [Deltaproteobacteria bacterium]